MSGVPYIFANATTSIPLSELDVNFATPVTIGNTTVALGNTVTSFGNVTLVNTTITTGSVTTDLTVHGLTVGLGSGSVSGNTVFGYQAGYSNSTGSSVDAFGYQALYSNTTGYNNTAIGYQALYAVTYGNTNVGVGYQAGNTITTGANNTCIGNGAQPSSATVSNTITLGNSSVSTLRCQVQTITALSDVRDKTNIENIPVGLDYIRAMRPVMFDWNTRDGSRQGRKDFGWISQDLDKLQEKFGYAEYTRLVNKDNPDAWEADPLKTYPILVKAVQELADEVDRLVNILKNNGLM